MTKIVSRPWSPERQTHVHTGKAVLETSGRRDRWFVDGIRKQTCNTAICGIKKLDPLFNRKYKWWVAGGFRTKCKTNLQNFIQKME